MKPAQVTGTKVTISSNLKICSTVFRKQPLQHSRAAIRYYRRFRWRDVHGDFANQLETNDYNQLKESGWPIANMAWPGVTSLLYSIVSNTMDRVVTDHTRLFCIFAFQPTRRHHIYQTQMCIDSGCTNMSIRKSDYSRLINDPIQAQQTTVANYKIIARSSKTAQPSECIEHWGELNPWQLGHNERFWPSC